MKREENWNHLSVKREEMHRAYETQISRISFNIGTGLTGEQHTALMVLAHYRHCIHSARSVYSSLNKEASDRLRNFFLNKMNIMMRSAGLPELNIRYFLVESTENDYLRTAYIDEINDEIETYLSEIDKQYGTMYCPTGCRRTKRDDEAIVMEM